MGNKLVEEPYLFMGNILVKVLFLFKGNILVTGQFLTMGNIKGYGYPDVKRHSGKVHCCSQTLDRSRRSKLCDIIIVTLCSFGSSSLGFYWILFLVYLSNVLQTNKRRRWSNMFATLQLQLCDLVDFVV